METKIENVVFSCPPILENIFQYLLHYDLCQCAMVCSIWNRIANTEKDKRREIGCYCEYSLVPASEKSKAVFEERTGPRLRSTRLKPEICLAFASLKYAQSFKDVCKPDGKKKRKYAYGSKNNIKCCERGLSQMLKECVPNYCPTLVAISAGIIGIDALNNGEVPFETESGKAISTLILPPVPGFTIHPIQLNSRRYETSWVSSDLKCLLLFLTQRGANMAPLLVEQAQEATGGKVAVGGSIVYEGELAMGSGLTFSGENVEAASVIVDSQIRNYDLDKNLKKFQQTGLLKYPCFAFLFSCVARGYHFYGHSNVESVAFRNLYPDVPLIGMFGNGEIGLTYLPNSDKAPNTKKPKVNRAYTSVFVLVAIKDRLKKEKKSTPTERESKPSNKCDGACVNQGPSQPMHLRH